MIIEIVQKYKVGGIIGGAFFLMGYYFMGATKSITNNVLKLNASYLVEKYVK